MTTTALASKPAPRSVASLPPLLSNSCFDSSKLFEAESAPEEDAGNEPALDPMPVDCGALPFHLHPRGGFLTYVGEVPGAQQ